MCSDTISLKEDLRFQITLRRGTSTHKVHITGMLAWAFQAPFLSAPETDKPDIQNAVTCSTSFNKLLGFGRGL
jgi:hypothetical protein